MNDNPFTSTTPVSSVHGDDPSPGDRNDNTFGILCHLLALAGLSIPFGNVLGPLILWLVKRADSPYLDATGKEAVNFNITWAIYSALAALSILAFIGFVLFPLVSLTWIILVIVASLKASDGKIYRYPLTIRFFK